MDDNYMFPEELRAVADYCDALQSLWGALTGPSKGGVWVDTGAVELSVYDSNGEMLGRITWADAGAAFYPSANNVREE